MGSSKAEADMRFANSPKPPGLGSTALGLLVGAIITFSFGCAPGRSETSLVEVPLVFTPTSTSTPTEVPTIATSPPATATAPSTMKNTPTDQEELQNQNEETDGANLKATFTPDPSIICPVVVSDSEIEIPIDNTGLFMDVDVILDYLNRGGSPEKAIQAVADAHQGTIERMDLTGDGTPELVLHMFYFVVYQCEQGQYIQVLRVSPEDIMSPPMAHIRDLNANGIPELIVTTMFFGAHDGTLSMYVYEWDGQAFTSRLPAVIDHPLGERAVVYVAFGTAHMYNGTVRFEDVDSNGTIEIHLDGGGEDFYERTLWMWNGQEFALVEATQ
jgi:hypothetical protein